MKRRRFTPEVFSMPRETPHPFVLAIKTQCLTKELVDTINRIPTESEVAINALCCALTIVILSNKEEEIEPTIKTVTDRLTMLTENFKGRI